MDKHLTHRVVTFLSREELEFLDKIEKDIVFSSGMHVSRSKILEDLAHLLLKSHVDATGVKTNAELERRILEAIAKIIQEELKKGDLK